jgi:hypothetical protein
MNEKSLVLTVKAGVKPASLPVVDRLTSHYKPIELVVVREGVLHG